MTTPARLLISLSDIALLAKVQRPTVSMWRSRFRGKNSPFPEPVASRNGQEQFDAGQVAEWLTATGHGNNPDVEADLGAFAVASDLPRDTTLVFATLTALLALRVLTGETMVGKDADELLDLADEQDPDDELLFRELDAAGQALEPLARYAELLVEGAFHPAAAFEKLLADRFRQGLRPHTDVALTEPGMELVAAIAVELATALSDAPVFADPASGSSDLLLAVARILGDGTDATLMGGDDDGGSARLVRRRLLVHGLPQKRLAVEQSGAFGLTGSAVHVAQYPSPGSPDMDALQVLNAIDHSVLQMDDRQRGVVLGPASVLCDVLPKGDLRAIRSGLIRDGRVRAIVRLPKGLLKSKPRQISALWVLGPSHPNVPIPERWTMVADLTGESLTPDVVQDLVSDLAASMGSRAAIWAHSFRFARLVLTRSILPGDTSLVASAHAAPPQSVTAGATAALRADDILEALSTNSPANTLFRYSVEPVTETPARRRPRALGDLLTEKRVHYVQGNRLHDGETGSGNGTPVLGVPELLGEVPLGSRRVDLMSFSTLHENGRLTEPGDVVFCTGPRAAAVVDSEGSAVVDYPARILRINKERAGGLLPEMLTADINAQAGNRGPWKRWPVRQIRDDPGLEVAAFLTEIETQRTRARARLEQLEELTTLVLDGVAGGTLTVTDTYAAMEGNS
ncbi:hypothetical protein N2K95_14300 [Arthrobacter zhaoxinii]|uniref:DNA methylase adenine-specific domain-containing protein n=1 Tax=Arthrobacter zhaoxinii TaxID=2964616 RepID=A0ABY5YRU4_9MICC|nr:hypothetical protein [Arthrobacter zhaoxinii]UWX96793.1 hypothetical protein N2K95_14300 [Arthrobacter zhaoxinii]